MKLLFSDVTYSNLMIQCFSILRTWTWGLRCLLGLSFQAAPYCAFTAFLIIQLNGCSSECYSQCCVGTQKINFNINECTLSFILAITESLWSSQGNLQGLNVPHCVMADIPLKQAFKSWNVVFILYILVESIVCMWNLLTNVGNDEKNWDV